MGRSPRAGRPGALERVLRVPRPTSFQRPAPKALPRTAAVLAERAAKRSSDKSAKIPVPAPAKAQESAPQSSVVCPEAGECTSLDGLAAWAAGELGRRAAIKDLALPSDRQQAVRKTIGMPAAVPTSALDLIGSDRLGRTGWGAVEEWVPGASNRKTAPKWSTFERLDGSGLLRMLAASGSQADQASEAALVALLSRALSEDVLERTDLAPHVTRWVLEDPKRPERRVGRIAAVALGIHETRNRTASVATGLGTRIEQTAAATWLAPLGALSAVQQRVVQAAARLDHRAHSPGPVPFPLVFDSSLASAIGPVVGLGSDRRFVSDLVEEFYDPVQDLTIALADDGAMATAWVSVGGQGVFVAFDVEAGMPVGLPEPGMAWAAMVAIGWYLDLSVSDSKHYRAKRTAKGVRRWEPADPWRRQHARTSSGARVPPSAHYVRPHLRSYEERLGSDEARARAPLAIRRLMSPNDTWVRGYFVGAAPTPAEVRRNLKKASALADLLALEPLIQPVDPD